MQAKPKPLVCFIQYKIDPFKLEAFETYASNWGHIIPECGGELIGYFLPNEGTNDTAFGLIGFDSLADYEQYRARLKSDEGGRKNFLFAQTEKFIIEEKRTFLSVVPASFMQMAQVKVC